MRPRKRVRCPCCLPSSPDQRIMPPTLRPESGLTRRTVRVLVLPAPGGAAGCRVRFALREGADGWVEVAESFLAGPLTPGLPPDPAAAAANAYAEAAEVAPAQSWPMLLRGLEEAEAIVHAHHARRQREGSGGQSGSGGSGPPPTAGPASSVRLQRP